MTLHLHNTYSRTREEFQPLDPANVRMYVCGPTVYDDIHIGNARPLVVFDVLYRLLRHTYGADRVTYVRNITDVDDKIIERARERGEPIEALTARTAEGFAAAWAALGCLPPDAEPRATGHIPAMIALIEALVAKDHAYEADGHVLFHVPSWPDYGRLSGRNRDELVAGARVEVAPYKRDPADFVLWKPSADDQPGWDSPWGRGRPGWHVECSAMSEAHLGRTFDIHGGGVDLVFPHHENEIAQSVCAHDGAPFARYWVHNGYLMSEGEKMSKSLGNFYTVAELLAEFPGEALRLALLKTHYRQPLDFTKDGVREARAILDRLYRAVEALQNVTAEPYGENIVAIETPTSVVDDLNDDLNTPLAIATLQNIASYALNPNSLEELIYSPSGLKVNISMGQVKSRLFDSAKLLGLLQQDPEVWFRGTGGADADEISALIAERDAARRDKNFARADAIRDELAAHGIVLEDGPGGTTWRRA